MIGALIGAGLSAVSSIAGNIAANKKKAEERALLREQLRDNRALWNITKYSDPTKKGDFIAGLTEVRKDLQNRAHAARGTQAIMGGTQDAVLASNEAGNDLTAKVYRDRIADYERYKQQAETQFSNTEAALKGQQRAALKEDAGNIANAVKQVGAVASNIANGLDSVQGKAQAAGDENTSDTPVDTGKATEDYLMKQYGAGDLFNRKGGASV